MSEISIQSRHDRRRCLDLAHDRVAASAQETAHSSGGVAMVNDESPRGRIAERTVSALRGSHRGDICWCEPVALHEACAFILRPRQVRVRPSPFSEAFISTGLVGLPVGAAALVRAVTAVGAEVPTRPIERIARQVPLAVCASLHVYQHSRAARHSVDQPCHADVLLELANQ